MGRDSYMQTPILTEGDLLYIAGLFDGEGTGGVYKARSKYFLKNGEERISTGGQTYRIAIGMTDVDPIRFLHLCFGGSFSMRLYPLGKAKHKACHKPMYDWSLSNRKARDFASAILPYVKNLSKVAQLEKVVNAYDLYDHNRVAIRSEHTRRSWITRRSMQ